MFLLSRWLETPDACLRSLTQRWHNFLFEALSLAKLLFKWEILQQMNSTGVNRWFCAASLGCSTLFMQTWPDQSWIAFERWSEHETTWCLKVPSRTKTVINFWWWKYPEVSSIAASIVTYRRKSVTCHCAWTTVISYDELKPQHWYNIEEEEDLYWSLGGKCASPQQQKIAQCKRKRNYIQEKQKKQKKR